MSEYRSTILTIKHDGDRQFNYHAWVYLRVTQSDVAHFLQPVWHAQFVFLNKRNSEYSFLVLLIYCVANIDKLNQLAKLSSLMDGIAGHKKMQCSLNR